MRQLDRMGVHPQTCVTVSRREADQHSRLVEAAVLVPGVVDGPALDARDVHPGAEDVGGVAAEGGEGGEEGGSVQPAAVEGDVVVCEGG
jgi:hypothetical protein